ncbi:hypothetical protein [Labilibaculum antarcticum]|uniref:Uncharacterized protein n=1 Tax=Labilibaculum antarcticum TaxID=1717717 RepID=A0A1Y1CLA3_9BACT|nr:hypothetical protein [Labilibaculum antarcticum]BAX80833.1 hypothetical protein ALGA_2511 [Labilibaculum antarcticum]
MEALVGRLRTLIDTCWDSFSAKVGGELITINKEASMQLQFAYILKNSIDLIIYHQDETLEIELETGIPINGRMRECDIVMQITKGTQKAYLPIEMKCYKELASSGGKRGATDIFFKDVYVDLELLESYAKNESYIQGIQLVMTDFERIPFPKVRKGKFWDYDISDTKSITDGIHLMTPIGGFEVDIKLQGSYEFKWTTSGTYYFLKLENMK